jgi:hypothetical protein
MRPMGKGPLGGNIDSRDGWWVHGDEEARRMPNLVVGRRVYDDKLWLSDRRRCNTFYHYDDI